MSTTMQVPGFPSFHYCFQMSKSVIFNVSYYRLSNNNEKHFTTSADLFNRPKTDFNQCGQAQNDLLKGHAKAMNFYLKWDHMHCKDLSESQYNEMLQDIEVLKGQYNFIHDNNEDIRFSEERELSMRTPKKSKLNKAKV